SWSMFCSPARKYRALSPSQIQTPSRMMEGIAHAGERSQGMALNPMARSPALSSPKSWSNTSANISATTTSDVITGTKNATRKSPFSLSHLAFKARASSKAKGDSRNTLPAARSEEHTSELQSRENLVCRLLLEKKNQTHLGQ